MNINNPKAFHDYHILEKHVAGVVLKGHEVKSVKQGKANIKGAYIKILKKELFILGMNISKYLGEGEEHRIKKLLMHRHEIDKLSKKVEQKGLTLVPLSVFQQEGLVKLSLGVAQGKKNYDKREALMKKSIKRDMDRALKRSK